MKRLEQIIKLVSEYEKIDVNTLSEIKCIESND